MATVRVCRVIDVPAAKVFGALVDWGGWDKWSPMLSGAVLEPAGALPGTVGAVRSLSRGDGPTVRERLLACDEEALTVSYGMEGKPPFPARRYNALVRLLPLTDREATVVDWSASVDADEADEPGLIKALTGYFNGFIDQLAAWGGSAA